MNIQGKKVLILGGAGMVGMAVARQLLSESPREIVIHSLHKAEVDEALVALAEEQALLTSRSALFAEAPIQVDLSGDHGNLFVRLGLHEREPSGLMGDPEARRAIIEDLIGDFGDVSDRFFLYDLLARQQPDLVVDTVNTATGIAYGDLYTVSTQAYQATLTGSKDQLKEATERLIATQYVPQMVRHVQVLYKGMKDAGTQFYVKVGTSGTGGMGLNIPYTHGEEKPSRMLLSKSAIAGAHTLLLFLMARTPDSPITKEIKPAAAIAWKHYGYGEIKRRGKPIVLHDAEGPDDGPLKAVFVDTGENGLFSVDEFVAITTSGQMEFVTPEEIAVNIIAEVKGANTGKDVIDALNIACMGPTYRAGFSRSFLLSKLRRLQQDVELADNHTLAMAFEVLGPPRLSKLLYEAYLLKLEYGTLDAAAAAAPPEMAERLLTRIQGDAELRKKILSIGIPILYEMAGGLALIRGHEVAVPKGRAFDLADPDDVALWAEAGWVDLRQPSMERWTLRTRAILAEMALIPAWDTSSRYLRDREFWGVTDGSALIDPGEVVGWIFNTEERGERGR